MSKIVKAILSARFSVKRGRGFGNIRAVVSGERCQLRVILENLPHSHCTCFKCHILQSPSA